MSMNTNSPTLQKHYPGLDSLRGLAVLFVFLHHYVGGYMANDPVLNWGWVGVEIFFVLSGFLITGILFESLEAPHFFRNFYIRRTLRIFPVYYGFWALMLLLTPITRVHWDHHVVLWLFYLGNYSTTSWNLELHGHAMTGAMIVVGHFWSLCIEEHFYMLWPLIIFAVRKRLTLQRICVGGVLLTLIARCLITWQHPAIAYPALYTYSIARFDAPLIGSWAALWVRGPIPGYQRIRARACQWGLVFLAILIGSQIVTDFVCGFPAASLPLPSIHWVTAYGFTVIDLASLCLLFLCLDATSFFSRLLDVLHLRRLGKISYGFYVIHMLYFDFAKNYYGRFARHNLAIEFVVGCFLLTYLLAELSYRYYETPFLRLKDRWAKKPKGIMTEPI
jgi:peptidoglycan/LPS O-acetylase OafA/YrhL